VNLLRLSVLFLTTLFLLTPHVGHSQQESRFRIRIDLNVIGPEKYSRLPASLDIAGRNYIKGTLDIIADPNTFLILDRMEIAFEIIERQDEVELSDAYKTNDEVAEFLAAKADEFPDIIKVVTIGKSHEGRDILAVKISDNVEKDEIEPVILFNALHHAREVMTIEVALDIINMLTSGYEIHDRISQYVDFAEIWVIPVANPDGLNRIWTRDTWWRKNARADEKTNVYGVDLNRNYPYQWGSCNGSSGSRGSQTYRGPNAASEPETQALIQFITQIQPIFNISYHSYSELVLFPYGCRKMYVAESDLVSKIGKELASRLIKDSGRGSYAPGTPWEILYSVDGDDISWQYAAVGTIPFVIELNSSSQGFQPDYDKWRDTTVSRSRAGWSYLIERMLSGPILAGQVVDTITGQPVSARIHVRGIEYKKDEVPRSSKSSTGEFFKIMDSGHHTIGFHAEDYEPEEVDIEFTDKPVFVTIRLQPKY